MNTFKKYSTKIPEFYKKILETNPDYIVPVERKGCKLIRLLESKQVRELDTHFDKIRYRQFFENVKPSLEGKVIAVIDDASKYTSTLFEYRQYFEELGAKVNTYSFVGQDGLRTGERKKYDEEAVIFQYLKESTYQEYIIQQSIELSKSEYAFDIDHLVFQTKLSVEKYRKFLMQASDLGEIDYTNDVYTPEDIIKLCCYNFNFPIHLPFDEEQRIYQASVIKMRISYNKKTEILSLVPLYYPSWDITTFAKLKNELVTIPFQLPYKLTSALSEEGMYMNIIYICNLYLLKQFISKFQNLDELKILSLSSYDLTAYIGREDSEQVAHSAQQFISRACDLIKSPLKELPCNKIEKVQDPKIKSIMALMKNLRDEYERRLSNSSSLLEVKYYLPFYDLYSRYSGKANLVKWIDILCDRGVMVVRNVLLNGQYCRACRSGEADYDHIEKKTAILLPIIINICGKKTGQTCRIKATLLNKIVANLSYDYPMDQYDFHHFFTKPYLYGPFSYVKNRLNDEIEIPLYDVEKISSYCTYDETTREFVSLDYQLIKKDLEAFSQSDLVPLSEIISYIDLLKETSTIFGTADILNQLIICRNQDIYYKHVHFDIITAYHNLMIAYKSPIASKSERYLRDAAKVANEAAKKLSYDPKRLFDDFEKTFQSELRFFSSYNKIISSKVDFSKEFFETLKNLRYVTSLEQALTNLLLYKFTFDQKYLSKFLNIEQKFSFIEESKEKLIRELSVAIDTQTTDFSLYEKNTKVIESIVDILFEILFSRIKELKKPSDSDYVLSNRKKDVEVAINNSVHYIKNNKLEQYAFLRFDFSGYRNIDGTKSINVIDYVHSTVKYLLDSEKGGYYVYGLVGSNTFGTILFDSTLNAIKFANDLQQLFINNKIQQIDFKFGCAYRKFSHSLREHVMSAWKESEDCSKLSLRQKKHYASFAITEESFNQIEEELKSNFTMITSNDNRYYLHNDFENTDSERIKRYHTETDENVQIGIITALTEEFVAMQKMLCNPKTVIFPKTKRNGVVGREFCIGQISSLDGSEHNVVLTQTIGPGNTAAATRANCLLERFPNINVIIMTGIAGGIPSPDNKEKHVRLGDVVIAKTIVSYDFVSDKNSITELRGRSVAPSARLMEAQNHLDRSEFLGKKPWEKYIKDVISDMPKSYSRPPVSSDVLYDCKNKIIPHPVDDSRNENPRIFKGNIASANRVLKNAKRRDQLKANYNVYAVEMEGSGIADSTWEAEIGYYVIRGISDYCDGNKNDRWHNYAALAAAAYTRALIEKLPY